MAFVDDLDVQILICAFLHPSDILTLRKTCKTLQFATRQRTIWVDALRRVCLKNTLFLPSFPILDMSDMELEQAAIAPLRWIELSTSFAARGLSDSKVRLSPITTRIIGDPFGSKQNTRLVLIPGGRYLVGFSPTGLGVWDLGYISSADCKLIASVGPEGGSSSGDVHVTPDGMGLVILSLRPDEHCFVYEIYPQNEIPQLTKIACLGLPCHRNLASYVSPDKMIWFMFHPQGIIFRVWDYRLNASVSFLALVDENSRYSRKVVATQTAIVMLSEDDIFIWAIPPLLPQTPNFDDYSPTRFPPEIRIKFPDESLVPNYPPRSSWRVMSGWYFDPSKPLYFDKIIHLWPLQLQRFKIIINPDVSDATLHFINTIDITHDFGRATVFPPIFCEDNMVYGWSSSDQCQIYSGSTLSHPILHRDQSITKISLAVGKPRYPRGLRICPASGRFVHLDSGLDADKIVVFDFLPHQRGSII